MGLVERADDCRYFGDSEVWRISTAEPRVRGVMWEVVKDMSQ
jgi:Peptide N-acetyl-beta-D-glucosaminyl asparaginase amidase A